MKELPAWHVFREVTGVSEWLLRTDSPTTGPNADQDPVTEGFETVAAEFAVAFQVEGR